MNIISLGIGSPASIPVLTLFGLAPTGPIAPTELSAEDASLFVRLQRQTVYARQGGPMIQPLEPKTSYEEKDYGVDWSLWLASDVTIDTSTWEVGSSTGSPADLTLAVEDIDGQVTLVRVADGVEGEDYILYNKIETSVGELLQQAIKVRVKTPEAIASL